MCLLDLTGLIYAILLKDDRKKWVKSKFFPFIQVLIFKYLQDFQDHQKELEIVNPLYGISCKCKIRRLCNQSFSF